MISLFSRCTYKVLQRHHAVDRFCANLKGLRPLWFEVNGKGLNALELIEKSGGLVSSFSWDCTREGREFWVKINHEVLTVHSLVLKLQKDIRFGKN